MTQCKKTKKMTALTTGTPDSDGIIFTSGSAAAEARCHGTLYRAVFALGEVCTCICKPIKAPTLVASLATAFATAFATPFAGRSGTLQLHKVALHICYVLIITNIQPCSTDVFKGFKVTTINGWMGDIEPFCPEVSNAWYWGCGGSHLWWCYKLFTFWLYADDIGFKITNRVPWIEECAGATLFLYIFKAIKCWCTLIKFTTVFFMLLDLWRRIRTSFLIWSYGWSNF